jgi:glycosyltransferase involved in cell wall biosynthesis
MNILHLSWRGPNHPRAGGAEIVVHEHSKAWIKDGHKVTLFTSNFEGGKPEEVIDGILIKRGGKDLSFTVIAYALWWYIFKRREEYDLVIDHFHGLPFFTPLYIKSKKIAFIHEVAREVWKYNPYKFPLNKIIEFTGYVFEPLVIFIIYFFTPFITVSDSTKRALVNWGVASKNITVVNNGFNAIKFQKQIQKNTKKTVVYLGAVTPDKGIEDALAAFDLLSKKDKDYLFWIIGKGEKNYVEDLKKRTEDRSNLKFWGFVTQSKKFELLSKSHILINPSRLEGWGLVVIEAASMGVPTVGYKIPGLVDSVKHNVTGILVEKDVERLAEAIDRLINDQVRYKHMVDNCVKWSKRFSWDKSAKKSLEILHKFR